MKRFLLFCFLVLVMTMLAYAQSATPLNGNSIHWEVRRYFWQSSMMLNEFMLVIKTGSIENKVFVGTAPLLPENRCNTSWTGGGQTLFSSIGKQIGLTDLGLTVDETGLQIDLLHHYWPAPTEGDDPPHRQPITHVNLANAHSFRLQAPVYVDADKLFSRQLFLKTAPVRGDDVWVLQRYLDVKGYHLADGPSGAFDTETAELVRTYQEDRQSSSIRTDGVVDRDSWDWITAPFPEPKADPGFE